MEIATWILDFPAASSFLNFHQSRFVDKVFLEIQLERQKIAQS